jgi:hypothetical protein
MIEVSQFRVSKSQVWGIPVTGRINHQSRLHRESAHFQINCDPTQFVKGMVIVPSNDKYAPLLNKLIDSRLEILVKSILRISEDSTPFEQGPELQEWRDIHQHPWEGSSDLPCAAWRQHRRYSVRDRVETSGSRLDAVLRCHRPASLFLENH